MGPWLLLFLLPLILIHFFTNKNYRYYIFLFCFAICIAFFDHATIYAAVNTQNNSNRISIWQRLTHNNQELASENIKSPNSTYTDPKIFSSPKWQAAAEYSNKNYQKSAEILQKLDLDSDINSRYNYANSLAKQGKLNEAVENYNKILQKDPKNADVLFNKQLLEKHLNSQNQSQNQNQNQNQKQNQEQKNNQKSDNNQSASNEKTQENNQNKNQDNKQKQLNNNKNASSNNLNPEEKHKQDQEDKQMAMQNSSDKTDPELEKWLNKIPDNPAVYLKNQLRYEYLLEQQINKN